MGAVYLCSDLHIGHVNIANYRKEVTSEADNRELIKSHWDKKVTKRDLVWVLGDAAFTEEAIDWIGQLNGEKRLVRGNHDILPTTSYLRTFSEVYGLFKYKKMWLSHAPVHPQELRGKVNLHGHCVDMETEIMTPDGWKGFNDIRSGDKVYSYCSETGKAVLDTVGDIIENNFTGNVVTWDNKSLSMRVTDGHRVTFKTKHKDYLVETAEAFSQRATAIFIKSACTSSGGVCLSDDMLALYIALAADGTVTQYNLARFRFKKQRKIDMLVSILDRLQIEYTRNVATDGMTNLNFRLPVELYSWNIKGLDWKLVECNEHQAGIIKETYSWTDGNRNLIFTSKKSEVDILQTMFHLNGYTAKVHGREGHGFSKGVSYQLSVTKRDSYTCTKNEKFIGNEFVVDEKFWCITTSNGNFFCRRRGSVHLTGNCHYHNISSEFGGDDIRYFNCSVENLMRVVGSPLISLDQLRSILNGTNI
jgi:calcineurin-like phosphoesterase family protein